MSKEQKLAFGIDIGGSGIKGAPVDVETGEFLGERVRIPTPENSTPEAVCEVVKELLEEFDLPADVPIGVAFPAPLDHGVVLKIANLDPSWEGRNIEKLISEATGRTVYSLNDADAAGFAEVKYGAAKDTDGVVLLATLGTGIGSALIVEGHLVPNTELGHLQLDGFDAESRAADSARTREDLSWEVWAARLQRYFSHVELLLSPDLIVVGGGVSKHHKEFLPLLDLRAKIIPAELRNAAGISGAAAYAADRARHGRKAGKKKAKKD
ncbi:polyphosphate--glucose phosphotransferase [Timonella senegalensis]|uniref:polyphosphate--glucose phosphotransferase n=1 Tax=Timonella senegalensis TaxID=1465825 RepID=UPI0002F55E53|nr:ROK family protein [Timonella senegalensis]